MKYFNIAFLCASVSLCLIFLFPVTKAHAANLSFDMGRNSSGISAGRDFKFGYAMLGLSTKFTTDYPWSYVPTRQSLEGPCQDFKNTDPKNCEKRGRYYDGDEWEVFGKLGYRLPVISRLYLNAGLGVSKQRISDLYVFREDIQLQNGVTSEFMETWGHVEDRYYLNLLGGVGISMTRRILLNVDYHTRKGLISGIMYRF
ncbi:MAG: hypothetical protein HZA08_05165 [Nitrospirae bacterium]|nr:hypothetical protein [Nitrospirota bacterium]